MNNEHDIGYGINDLGQATALACRGYEVMDLVPSLGTGRVTFYFKSDESIDAVAQMYWSGKLTVDAKQYWQEMKNLKARLYSLR